MILPIDPAKPLKNQKALVTAAIICASGGDAFAFPADVSQEKEVEEMLPRPAGFATGG